MIIFNKNFERSPRKQWIALIATGFLGHAAGGVAAVPPEQSKPPQWGSFLTPYAADSLWNARPVKPVFGSAVMKRR